MKTSRYFASTAAGIVLGLILAAAIMQAGCTASGREKVISTTYASTNAAFAAFQAYDHQHYLDLVKAAPDRAASDAAIAAWKKTSDEVGTGFVLALKALGTAADLNDDQSLAGALQAVGIVYGELKALGVKLP